jgi:hypothetical protein
MPLSRNQLLLLLALPFAAAIVIAAIARLLAPRRVHREPEEYAGIPESPRHFPAWPARLALPLALALGPVLALCVAPYIFKNDAVVTPKLWPHDTRDWYLLTTIVALALGVAAVWLPRRFTALALAELGTLLALRMSINPSYSIPVEIWPALAAPAFLYAVLEPLARRNHNLALPIILLLLAASAVFVEGDGNSPIHGFTCLPLPAALLGVVVAYFLLPDRDLSRAALPAFLLLYMAILFYGYFDADVTWQRTLILLGSPLAAYAADLPPIRWLRPFWRASARAVLVAIPLAFAVVPAAKDLHQQMNQAAQMQDM